MKLKNLACMASILVASLSGVKAATTTPVMLPGQIAVMKCGTSDTNWPILTSRSQPVFVQVFNATLTNPVPVLSVAMSTNTSVPGSVWVNAHAGSEGGGLSRSVDRSFLALEGYTGNILSPTALKPSTDPTVTRGIVSLDAFTNAVDVYSSLTLWFGIPVGSIYGAQDNPTGIAALDATNFWGTGNFAASGSQGELDGTLYYNPNLNLDPTSGAATPVEVQNYLQAAAEARIIGGTLYIAAKPTTGVASGIYNFVDGGGNVVPLPQSANYPGYTYTNLFINWGTTFKLICNFDMNPQGTIAYGADQEYGIVKFTKNAGVWQQASYYFKTNNLGISPGQPANNHGCFGICVDFSGANPVIYATTMENGYPTINTTQGHQNQNRLIRVVDTGVDPGTTLVAQTLAVASTTNEFFGGIDFTPDLRPLISTNPVSYSTTVGNAASFIVGASSPYALSYQWTENGTNLVSQTNTSVTLSSLSTNNNGFSYQCIITNAYGAVTSTPAILTVTASPVTPVITSGTNYVFGYFYGNTAFPAVTASGTQPFTYQWYFKGTSLSDGINVSGSAYFGSQSASLVVSNLQASDAGNYYLVVMNPVGGYASNIVDVLTVNYRLPAIAFGLPASGTTFVSNAITLNVTTSGGTAPVTNQWYACNTAAFATNTVSYPLSDGGEFSGTATTALAIQANLFADATNYYYVASNGGGSVTSAVATVSIIVPPAHASLSYSNQLYLQTFDTLPDPGTGGTGVGGAVNSGASVNSINNPLDNGSINGVFYSLANPFDFAYPVVNNNYIGGLGLSNSMSGWYGSAATNDSTSPAYWPNVDGLTRFGAQDGDQTTGGVIDFGLNDAQGGITGTNRALGLLSTSTTGPTSFALKLVNKSGSPMSYLNVSFLGELWRNSTGARVISFGYTNDDTGTNFVLDSTSISNCTLVPSMNISFPTASVATIVDGTQSSNQLNLAVTNLALANPWPTNGALWLVWSINFYGAGGGQGLAIDNLAVSATATAVTSTAPTVSGLSVSNLTATAATLDFNVNPNNGATVYRISYGTTATYANTTTGNLVAGTTGVIVTKALTGLLPNTTYHYQINAQNFTGQNVTTDATFTTPALAPVVVTKGAVSIAATNASFTGSVNPGGLATAYWYNYGLTAAYGSVSVTNNLAAGGVTVSFTNKITGLLPGTVYHYQIAASNSLGTVYGLDTNFTTLVAAPVPTTVAATLITVNGAQLNASVNPNGGSTTNWFQYGPTTSYGSFTTTNIVPAGTGSVSFSNTITGLTPATTYHFRLVAANSTVTTNGLDASFTTLSVTPSTLNGVTMSGGKLAFSFTNATGLSFSILATNNIAAPKATWPVVGTAVENPAGSGNYQFTNTASTNAQLFYLLRQP